MVGTLLIVIGSIITLLALLALAGLIVHIREDRARVGHNWEDSSCAHWTGDRAGYDLRARCRICTPERTP